MNGCTGQVAPVLLPLSLQKITNKPVIEAFQRALQRDDLDKKTLAMLGLGVFRVP